MRISAGVSYWEKEGKDGARAGTLFPGKRFHTVLISSQTILGDETEAQNIMGWWWAGPHLDQDCPDVHILGPLFKLQSYIRTPNNRLGGPAESLCLCYPGGHFSIINLALLIGLLGWVTEHSL